MREYIMIPALPTDDPSCMSSTSSYVPSHASCAVDPATHACYNNNSLAHSDRAFRVISELPYIHDCMTNKTNDSHKPLTPASYLCSYLCIHQQVMHHNACIYISYLQQSSFCTHSGSSNLVVQVASNYCLLLSVKFAWSRQNGYTR